MALPSLSLQNRISLAVAGAATAVAVLLTAVAIGLTRHELRAQVDAQLEAVVVRMDAALPGLEQSLQRRQRNAGPWLSRMLVESSIQGRLFDADGELLGETGYHPVPLSAEDLEVAAGEHNLSFRDIRVDDNSFRSLTFPLGTVRVSQEDGTMVRKQLAVQVVRSTAEIDAAVRNLTFAFGGLGFLGAVLALSLGQRVAASAVRPVAQLAAVASHVASTEDLAVDVPESGGAELEELARSFKTMLRTLESSRAQQLQLVADAGHELRTPLTSLRTNIEVLGAQGELSAPDRASLLRDVDAQLTELSGLVADLVELARSDSGGGAEFTDVRLDQVVEAALTRARLRAGDVTFDVATIPVVLDGQAALLERAVLNILDNAVKWSPPDGVVTVRVNRSGLTVADQGPGIAETDRAHVFERFWRSDAVRDDPGSGLGLAIVRQVIEAHGGTVAVDTAPGGGALIRVTLPVAPVESR